MHDDVGIIGDGDNAADTDATGNDEDRECLRRGGDSSRRLLWLFSVAAAFVSSSTTRSSSIGGLSRSVIP